MWILVCILKRMASLIYIMFFRFIHVDTCRSSYSLLMLYASPPHEYTYCINLYILDNWGVSKFLLLWIISLWKNLNSSFGVYISPLGPYLAGELLGHREVSLILMGTLNFQKVAPTAMRVPVALHPHQHSALSALCSFVCHPGRC